jgi:DNA-binding transcriptional ArsR family regulator
MPSAMTLDDPAAIAAATHPVRAAVLDALRAPATAAVVARAIGQSRQNVAYHVRELEKVGLVRAVGERPNGNFIERTYQAVADTFVISPTCIWGEPHRRAAALADQLSLGELVEAGARLQRDSAVLLDRAAFDGDEIPSASVSTAMRFASEEDRAAFLREYLTLLTELVERHASKEGRPYRLLLAAYPDPEEDPRP